MPEIVLASAVRTQIGSVNGGGTGIAMSSRGPNDRARSRTMKALVYQGPGKKACRSTFFTAPVQRPPAAGTEAP